MPQFSITWASTAANSRSLAKYVSTLLIVNQLPKSLPDMKQLVLVSAIMGCLAVDRVKGQQDPNTSSAKVVSAEFISTALSPFWRASEIREPVFFIQVDETQRPQA